MTAPVTDSAEQAKRIRRAVEKSLAARNRYTEQQVTAVVAALRESEDLVKRALLQYADRDDLPDNKLAASQGLKRLQTEIDAIMRRLQTGQTLRFRKTIPQTVKLGIADGLDSFVDARIPGFIGLTEKQRDTRIQDAFNLIDRDALDFLTTYSLTLMGEVNRELQDGIHRTLLSAVVSGKGVDAVVRDLGKVVKDPDNFRKAGKKVFSKAQYRMEVIARTEILRAHNQGRLAFHREVGVKKLEWMTMEDERVCPECGPLDGKVFALNKLPNQPRHPN